MRVFYFITLMAFFRTEIGFTQLTLSLTQQQKDFRILKRTLLENTGSPYLFIDSTSLSKKIAEIESKLEPGKTSLDFFRLIAPLVSSLGCGHTQISPSKEIYRQFFRSNGSLPFDITLVDQKLFALHSFGKDPKILKGDRILEINGLKTEEILAKMYPLLSSDGYNTTKKDRDFRDFFLLYYFIAFGPQAHFEIKFIEKSGETHLLSVQGHAPPAEVFSSKENSPLMYKPEKSDYGLLRIDKKNNFSLLKLKSFKYARGKGYEKFLDDSFKRIRQSKTQYLIIDLRGNQGGWIQTKIFGYLANKPVVSAIASCNDIKQPYYKKYFKEKIKDDYRRYKKNIRKTRKSKNGIHTDTFRNDFISAYSFNGKKIVVLVDGLTFSAASDFATHLKTDCHATIIGERTGGSYSKGNTGILRLKLPESNIYIGINPLLVRVDGNIESNETGLPPDIEIHEPWPRQRKEDAWLEAALNYICIID